MVRRWSYINNINITDSKLYVKFNKTQRTLNILSYLYYRKTIWTVSKFTRKTWRRRKHINNFLTLNNTMSDWAQDYSFFKNYNKFIFSFKIFKKSFLAYNLIIVKNLNPASCVNSESFVFGFVNKPIFRYFLNLKFSNYTFLNSIKNVSWAHVSCPSDSSILASQNTNSSLVLYETNEVGLYSPKNSNNVLMTYGYIIGLLHNVQLSKLTELYKVFVLTFLTRLI